MYYSISTNNQNERALIQTANEVLEFYFKGDGRSRIESVKKTALYLEKLELYLFGKKRATESDFKTKFGKDYEIYWTEFVVVRNRINRCYKGESLLDFGIDHNARFVDWFLRVKRLVSEKVFDEANVNYLNNSNAFPWGDETLKGRERAELFYRNAKRAEKYYKMIDGCYDMYTSLILSRMAVEQYIKYLHEKNIGSIVKVVTNPITEKQQLKPLSFDEIRKVLEAGHIITGVESNEIYAVQKRGNLNAHSGYANYVMSAIHNIDVLKMCLNYFKTH